MKEALEKLTKRVESLESQVILLNTPTDGPALDRISPDSNLAEVNSSLATNVVASNRGQHPHAGKDNQNREHHFNVVISEVTESPKGTSRRDREKHDFDKVVEVISNLDPQINLSSVKDHMQL